MERRKYVVITVLSDTLSNSKSQRDQDKWNRLRQNHARSQENCTIARRKTFSFIRCRTRAQNLRMRKLNLLGGPLTVAVQCHATRENNVCAAPCNGISTKIYLGLLPNIRFSTKNQLDLAILIGEPSGKPRLRKHGQRRALAFQLLDGRYGAESPSEASTKLSWSLAPHTTGNLPRLIDRENSKQMHGITIPPGYENILCP